MRMDGWMDYAWIAGSGFDIIVHGMAWQGGAGHGGKFALPSLL